MLSDKHFSLRTVYYRSFFLLIVIPILLVSVTTLGVMRGLGGIDSWGRMWRETAIFWGTRISIMVL